MAENEKVLVLADGSERTMMTARHLADYLPGKEHKKVVLFHVVNSLPEELRELEGETTCAVLLEELKRQADEGQKAVLETLEQAKASLLAGGMPEGSVEIKIQSSKNGVAADIIEEAREGGYIAVIMRRRGMGAIKNIILGSVAFKLLQSLTFLPVILLGPAPATKRVLLAVDASPNSKRAVEFVAAVLANHDHEICIFHAVVGLGAIQFDPEKDAALRISEEDQENDCLDAYKQKVGKLMLAVRDRLLAAGFAKSRLSIKVGTGARNRAEAIVDEADQGGYGTVVVGRRGLSKTEAFFMGRVSHAVVHAGRDLSVWVI